MNAFEIIKTARLTEKGTRQSEKPNKYNQHKYTVVADPRANKQQIRQAVQELFKVKVVRVNTLNVRGKARRQRTTQAGRAPNWKKAIVTLKEGDKIVLT
jgi:large subunit ribosomal protein L23